MTKLSLHRRHGGWGWTLGWRGGRAGGMVALAALLAFISAAPALAERPPRDQFSGLWRRVESRETRISDLEFRRLCAEIWRFEQDQPLMAREFLMMLPFGRVYLDQDQVFIASHFYDVGVRGAVFLDEHRFSEFGGRKFGFGRSGTFAYLFSGVLFERARPMLRVLRPDGETAFFQKCES